MAREIVTPIPTEPVGYPDPDEMARLVREMQEERRRNSELPFHEDPLFKNVPIYEGPAPADLAERHDDYLYGQED